MNVHVCVCVAALHRILCVVIITSKMCVLLLGNIIININVHISAAAWHVILYSSLVFVHLSHHSKNNHHQHSHCS